MTKKTKIILISIASLLAVAIAVALIFLRPENTSDTTAQSSANSSAVSVSEKVESNSKENVKETVSKESVSSDKAGVGIDDMTAERGKTIRVPVSISNNPGIAASALKINYNGEKLTYIGYDEGEVFENYYFKEEKNAILFTNVENSDSKKNGVMFYLKFKVKDDAVLGDTEIKVDATNESFVNFDEEFVKVGAGNAVITIK